MCFFQRTSFPTAIAHIDCNAFFASVEQVYHPALAHHPVAVSGMGGSCVITASYEARQQGIGTGMPIWEARKLCPQLVVVPADFRHYQLFHHKFLNIVAAFSPHLEAASIDECYVDLKGLKRLYRTSYRQICLQIKETVKTKLGISVSIGLAPTKTLAKIASNYRKPDGLTVVDGHDIPDFLARLPLEKVKGLGTNSRALLAKRGIQTPLEFVHCDPSVMRSLLGKIGVEMQLELRGFSMRPLQPIAPPPQSLSRTRSFRPTDSQPVIYRQLLENLSLAFWHLRNRRLKSGQIIVMLRDKNYRVYGAEIILADKISSDLAILRQVRQNFLKIYQAGQIYRSSGVICTNLQEEEQIPPQLFPEGPETRQQISLFEKIDGLNEKYGFQTVMLGGTVKKKLPTPPPPLEKLSTPFLGSVN